MFDYRGALSEGYTDEEIFDFLKKDRTDFDFDGALNEGYTPAQINEHVSQLDRQPPPVSSLGQSAPITVNRPKNVAEPSVTQVPETMLMDEASVTPAKTPSPAKAFVSGVGDMAAGLTQVVASDLTTPLRGATMEMDEPQRVMYDYGKKVVESGKKPKTFYDRVSSDFYNEKNLRIAKDAKSAEAGEFLNKVAENLRNKPDDERKNIEDAQFWLKQPAAALPQNWGRTVAAAATVAAESGAMTALAMVPFAGQAAMVGTEAGNWIDEARESGVDDPEIINNYSKLYGLISGGVEAVGGEILTAPVKGLGGKITKKIASKAVSDQVKKNLAKKILNSSFEGLGNIAIGALGEGGEEYSQSYISDVLKYKALLESAQKNPDKAEQYIAAAGQINLKPTAKERLNAAYFGTIAGGFTRGALGAAGKTITTAAATVKKPEVAPKVEAPAAAESTGKLLRDLGVTEEQYYQKPEEERTRIFDQLTEPERERILNLAPEETTQAPTGEQETVIEAKDPEYRNRITELAKTLQTARDKKLVQSVVESMTPEEAKDVLRESRGIPKAEISNIPQEELQQISAYAKEGKLLGGRTFKEGALPEVEKKDRSLLLDQNDELEKLGPELEKQVEGVKFRGATPGVAAPGKVVNPTMTFIDEYSGSNVEISKEGGVEELRKAVEAKRAADPESTIKAIAGKVGGLEFVKKEAITGKPIGVGKYETDYIYEFKDKDGNTVNIQRGDTPDKIKSILERKVSNEEKGRQGETLLKVEPIEKAAEQPGTATPPVEPARPASEIKLQTRALDALLNQYIKTGKAEGSISQELDKNVSDLINKANVNDIADAAGITVEQVNKAKQDPKSEEHGIIRKTFAPNLLYGQSVDEVLNQITEPRDESGNLMFAQRRIMDRDSADEYAVKYGLKHEGIKNGSRVFSDPKTGTSFRANTQDEISRALSDIRNGIAPKQTEKAGTGVRFAKRKTDLFDISESRAEELDNGADFKDANEQIEYELANRYQADIEYATDQGDEIELRKLKAKVASDRTKFRKQLGGEIHEGARKTVFGSPGMISNLEQATELKVERIKGRAQVTIKYRDGKPTYIGMHTSKIVPEFGPELGDNIIKHLLKGKTARYTAKDIDSFIGGKGVRFAKNKGERDERVLQPVQDENMLQDKRNEAGKKERSNSAEDEIVKAIYGEYGKESPGGVLKFIDGGPVQQQVGKAVEEITGDPVQLVEVDEAQLKKDGIDSFDGFRLNGTIYLNVSGRIQRPMLWTAFHEWYHGLSKSDKDYINEVVKLNKRGEKRLSEDGQEEFYADIIGEIMGEQKTLEALARKNPVKFKRVIQSLIDSINRIIEKFKKMVVGEEGEYNRYISDSEALRDRLVEVLNTRKMGRDMAEGVFEAYTESQGVMFAGEAQQMNLFPLAGLPLFDNAVDEKDVEQMDLFLEKKTEEPQMPEREPSGEITDFGEKIGGARKDYYANYSDAMKDAEKQDVTAVPLSKSWPEPNYDKLLEAGKDPWVVSFVHSVRDEIPSKPTVPYRVKMWASNVQTLRDMANKVLDGEYSKEKMKEMLSRPEYSRIGRMVEGRIELYNAIGHDNSLKGITFKKAHYSLYRGQKDVDKWVITQESKHGFGNDLVAADTKEAAIEEFKSRFEGKSKQERKTEFVIYQRRDNKKFYIAKKIGSKKYLEMKEFDSLKEARDYRQNNQQDLEEQLKKMKEFPSERREFNRERIGKDHRQGRDVTPEMFANTFGFRGVEFGNWVSNDERKDNLNRAYDALYDLANVLDIPTRALSLNGELGLGFGSRGHGGKRAPSAHYEPDRVVINLTKKNGPGSLAHEWWHAFDNYISRQAGAPLGYASDSFIRNDKVRPELVSAVRDIMTAIGKTGLKKRSEVMDETRTEDYWSTEIEMAARAFENYVIGKLADMGANNDYLVNIAASEEWAKSLAELILSGREPDKSYPYFTNEELKEVSPVFDKLFNTVETKESEGKVALFAGRQTDTEAFKKWFDGSKVVDENGEPLVVYHSTNKEIDVFDVKNTPFKAAFFTPSDLSAKLLAANKGNGAATYKVYLSIKNPLKINTSLSEGAWAADFDLDIIKKAKELGHDGVEVRIKSNDYDKVQYYIVFDPNQIKSATGNRGTFDPENPDIRFAKRKEPIQTVNTSYYQIDEIQRKRAALKRKLGKLKDETLDERLRLTEEIARLDVMNRDKVLAAIYQYAENIGLRGEAYSMVDRIMKTSKGKTGLLRAVEIMDGILERRQRTRFYKAAEKAVADAYEYLNRIAGRTRATTDLETNRALKDYLTQITGGTEEEKRKADMMVRYYNEYGDEDLKQNRDKFVDELGEDVIEWIEGGQTGAVPENAKRFIKTLASKGLTSMSNTQLVRIVNDLKNLRREGRTMKSIQEEQRRKKFDSDTKQISAVISSNAKQKPESRADIAFNPDRKKRDGFFKTTGNIEYDLTDSERIIQKLAGDKGRSLFKRTVFDPMYYADTEKKKGVKSALKWYQETHRDPDTGKQVSMAEVRRPFINVAMESRDKDGNLKTVEKPVTIAQLMKMYAHSQNPSQREHLIWTLMEPSKSASKRERMAENDLKRAIAEATIDKAVAALPEKYKDMVRKTWKHFDEEQWQRINKVFSDEHGIDMPKEKNYFPIKGLQLEREGAGIEADLLARSGIKAGVSKGFTKGRVNSTAALGSSDYFDDLVSNMLQTEHYIAFSKPVREVSRILNQPDVRKAIKAYSEPAWNAIDDWLKAMAYGRMNYGTKDSTSEKWIRILRNNYSVFQLGLKPLTVALQTASWFKGLSGVEKKQAIASLARFARNPVLFNREINEKSAQQESRMQNYEQGIQEAIEDNMRQTTIGSLKTKEALAEALRSAVMAPMGWVDKGVSNLIWDAKYHEAINKGATESEAIYQADELVRKTQSGGGLLASNQFMRGGEFQRMFTQFQSDPMKTVNLLMEFKNHFNEMSAAEKMNLVVFGIIAPAMAVYVIRNLRWPWEEPEEVAKEAERSIVSGIPFIGAIFDAIATFGLDEVKKLRGLPVDKSMYNYIADMDAPLFSPFSNIGQGILKHDLGKLGEGISGTFGVPAGAQIMRIIENADIALKQGNIKYLFLSKKAVNKEFDDMVKMMHSKPSASSSVSYVKKQHDRAKDIMSTWTPEKKKAFEDYQKTNRKMKAEQSKPSQ